MQCIIKNFLDLTIGEILDKQFFQQSFHEFMEHKQFFIHRLFFKLVLLSFFPQVFRLRLLSRRFSTFQQFFLFPLSFPLLPFSQLSSQFLFFKVLKLLLYLLHFTIYDLTRSSNQCFFCSELTSFSSFHYRKLDYPQCSFFIIFFEEIDGQQKTFLWFL